MNFEMSSKKLIPNKLCVKLDAQVESSTIISMFRKYGQVFSFYRTFDKKTGFVQYTTEVEAMNAITALRVAGYRVNLAYEKQRHLPIAESGPREIDKVRNPKKLRLFNLCIQMADTDIYTACSQYGKIEFFYRTVSRTEAYCTYATESDAENALAKLLEDTFEVSYAFTKLSFVRQIADIKNESEKKCETKSENLSMECNAASLCTHCGKAATLKCSVCADTYCSKKCQDVDWPIHRNNCKLVPDLEPIGVTKSEPTVEKVIPATMTDNKRIRLNADTEKNVKTAKYVIPKIRIARVCGATAESENLTKTLPQKPKNAKTVDHCPISTKKRGICHICNELTREHCQLCALPLCIREASNCFHKFHLKIAVDQNRHFAGRNENQSCFKCKHCNQSRARFYCMNCASETSGKRAHFCLTNDRNCFEKFHNLHFN